MPKTILNPPQVITTSTQSTVNHKKILAILFYRRFLILGVSSLVIAISSLVAFLIKPSYESSMEILVTVKSVPGISSSKAQEPISSSLTNTNFPFIDNNAQIKLMLSNQLIQKAVDSLRYHYPKITLEDIKDQKSSLMVTQVGETSRINQILSQAFKISFKDYDPIKAKRVLQALQKVYQNYDVEQRQQRLNEGVAFVNNRLPKIQEELKIAEKKLEKFRQQYKVIDPSIQSKILLESLADIQKQRQTTSAQIQELRATYNNLQKAISSLPQTPIAAPSLDSQRYQVLLNEIQKTEVSLEKAQIRYTDDYPIVTKLKQQYQRQLKLLKQLLGDQALTPNVIKDPQLTQQQISGVDSQLVNNLIQVEGNILGLIASDKNLAESEQKIRSELSIYPRLIAEYNRLVPEVTSHRQILDQLIQSRQSLEMKIAQGGFDWQIIEEPSLGINIGNGRLLLLLGGILFSPFLGIFAALMREHFADAIISVQDLQQLTNQPLLGSVPKLKISPHKQQHKRLTSNQQNLSNSVIGEIIPGLPVYETLDMIYQNIQIFNYPISCKSLMLTSAIPREGKTTVTLGLAASAAHMHRRVLVIDANLRFPNLHKMLNLPNDWGLSLLLVDETTTEFHDYIQPIHPYVDILTA